MTNHANESGGPEGIAYGLDKSCLLGGIAFCEGRQIDEGYCPFGHTSDLRQRYKSGNGI